MKYLIIYKRKYASGYSIGEFNTPGEVLNAILAGGYEGSEIIIARRMALSVTDAVEVPVVEIMQPDVAIAIQPPPAVPAPVADAHFSEVEL